MSPRQLLHLSIAGTVASFTTVLVEFGMTGDWSPVLAGGIGVAAAVLYLSGARALALPQWLREHGSSIIILALSVALLVIAMTVWTRDDRPALEQAVTEESSTAQSVEDQSIATPPTLERQNDNVSGTTPEDMLEISPTTKATPAKRIFTPRTPSELMDIATNQTKRDALEHKGT